MALISITHQEDKTTFSFKVNDPTSVTAAEVKRIGNKMGVKALFVNGKYYAL